MSNKTIKFVPLSDGKRAISTTILPNRPVALVDIDILKALVNLMSLESLDEYKKNLITGIEGAANREEIIAILGKRISFHHLLKTVEDISIETLKDGTVQLSYQEEVLTDEIIDKITV